jgi:hypothetical protein
MTTNVTANRKPKPGSVVLCAYCATLLRFEKDFAVRLLSDEEFRALHPEEQLLLSRAQAAFSQKKNPGPVRH